MANHKRVQKIGRSLWVLSSLVAQIALAGEISFTAQVDQKRVGPDDTVSLNFTVKTDTASRVSEPEFTAPDFEVINQYSSISVSSQYDMSRNRFLMQNIQQITKVMRPMKKGTLTISNIKLSAAGKTISVPDIVIEVDSKYQGSQGNNSPQQAQPNLNLGPSQRRPIPQTGNSNKRVRGNEAFVVAEISKDSAYKGEQIIVSYYLYHQMRVFNVQVDKFPILNGFLREDLEIPAMGSQLTSEAVTLKGVPYERSLLAKYAAYPLQEGRMAIDNISVKFNYYVNSGNQDEEDPFFGFFQQLSPRVGAVKSDVLEVDVLPVPEQGRPDNFSGGVGNFTLTSAVDKYDVRANEAVTLTVKVEGRGNVSSIHEPKAQWPQGIELYDSKGKSIAGRSGVGEKVFEFLLIPRVPGQYEVPSIELSFFDPKAKKYYSQKTEPFRLNVMAPAPGTSLIPPKQGADAQSGASNSAGSSGDPSKLSPEKESLRYLKSPDEVQRGFNWKALQVILLAIAALTGLYWSWLFLQDLFHLRKKKIERVQKGKAKDFTEKLGQLESVAREAVKGVRWQEVTHAYEAMSELILDWLEDRSRLGVRSISREQLKELLVSERGLPEPVWTQIAEILDYADLVKFAGGAGAVSETHARSDLGKWVNKIENVIANSNRYFL